MALDGFSKVYSKKSKESPAPRMSRGSRSDPGTLPSNESNASQPSRRSNASQTSSMTNRTRHSTSLNSSDGTASTSLVGESWLRFMPFNHLMMTLLTIAIVLFSIISAGCTTNSLRNVYLLSLTYNDEVTNFSSNSSAVLTSMIGNTTNLLELRVAFIGTCVKLTFGWTCSPDFSTVANKVSKVTDIADLSTTESFDPLGLMNIGKSFRDEVIFDGLMFVAVGCSFIAIFLFYSFGNFNEPEETPEPHGQSSNSERDSREAQTKQKPFPARQVSRVALTFTLVAAVLALLSVFWQHLGSAGAATMVEVSTHGTIEARLGSVAMGLGWTAVILNFVVFMGTLLLMFSVRVMLYLHF